jgi:uncharacterized protein YraI
MNLYLHHLRPTHRSPWTSRGRAAWLASVLLFVLTGCVIPRFPTGQVQTLPAASTPVIAVAPNNAAAGDYVAVSGAGWNASETVFINLETQTDGEALAMTVAVITADADGKFTASFFVPEEMGDSDMPELTVAATSTARTGKVTAMLMLVDAVAAVPTAVVPPTATPVVATPTRSPTQVAPSGANTARVTSRGLNLRSGPGASYAIVRALDQGTVLTVLGQSGDSYWLYVQTRDGALGWVARPYTDFTGSAPIVNQPAPTPVTPRPTPVPTATPVGQPNAWRGEYYPNRSLTPPALFERYDANIDFDWGSGSPGSGLPNDNFSVRWTRSLYLEGGTYRFYAVADDGVRLWVNGDRLIDQWRETSATTYSAERTLASGYHTLRVEYFEALQRARIRIWWERVSDFPQWRGEYFANRTLDGAPVVVRNDENLDFDWGRNAPAAGLPADNFSVRWTRNLYFDAGTWRFRTLVDDGVRVFVDGRLVIDEWRDGSARERSGEIDLAAGTYTVVVEYYERAGDARIRLWWERGSGGASYPDWKGEYWDNRRLEGNPVTVHNDRRIDFNWGSGSPDDRIPNDNFSARWTRTVDFERGLYRFSARADDGIRVWVDGDRVINEWDENEFDNQYTAEVFLDGDVDLRVEYFERRGGARVRFSWERIAEQPTATPTLSPFTDVNPSAAGPGEQVFVTGGGFPANMQVAVYLGSLVRASAAGAAAPQPLATTVTDNRGFYRMTIVLPAAWPDGSSVELGELTVIVATNDLGISAADTLTFRVPPVSGNPYVVVSPEQGDPGILVGVKGGGFPANTRVNLHLAGLAAARAEDQPESYASATTDGAGNFNFSFNLPRQWKESDDDIPTGKLLFIVATDDFRVQASASFDFFQTRPSPMIQILPTSGGAGTQVRATGGGFPADTPVNLHLVTLGEQVGRGNESIYATTTTDRNGNYSLVFAMPATWPDGRPIDVDRLVVIVATQDFSIQASDIFLYALSPPPGPTATPPATLPPPTQPVANINPGSGTAGTIVNVFGNGFPGNTTLSVYLAEFDSGGGRVNETLKYATTTSDADGNYLMPFTMPSQWPNGDDIESGRLVVLVATDDFSVQATALFDYEEATVSAAPAELLPVAVPTETPVETPVATEPAPPAEGTGN